MVTGTVVFRLLQSVSGITGLFLDIKGGLKNSFLITEIDDYNYRTLTNRFKHRKEFLFFEQKQISEVSSTMNPGDYRVRFSF